MEIERYRSPDGLLNLVVVREENDLIVHFDAGPSHTHGDALIGEYASIGETLHSPEAAVERYVADILSNRIKIIVSRMDGKIRDVSALPYDVPDETQYLDVGETIELRYWAQNTLTTARTP